MPRNTDSERRAVDRMVQRRCEQDQREGRLPDGDRARREAVRIAERSEAERRDGKPRVRPDR